MEENLLFAVQWDQSRWSIRFNVDQALRTVDCCVVGYGGRNGNLICSEGTFNAPMEAWREVLTKATVQLRAQLEAQLQPDN